MLAKELISQSIPTLAVTDSPALAASLMSRSGLSQIPVFDHNQYLGLLPADRIPKLNGQAGLTDRQPADLISASISDNQHVFEAIDLFGRFALTILPVLDLQKNYLGCITLQSLVASFSQLTAAGQPGALLILTMPEKDYSPTLISRIVEENGARILSFYAVSDPHGEGLSVTLKVNTEETTSMMRSFDRHGIFVKSHFQADTQLDEFYRSRYEELMKYMDI